MMNILLANLIILPAGVLCFLPVKANLKHSFPKTIAIMLPALFALIVLSSFLTWQFSLRGNDLLLPVLLISYLAYHFSLRLPFVKTLGVFTVVVALLAILSNFSACIDAFRNPDAGPESFTLTFSLFQLGITVIAILLLAYPFIKHGGFIIIQPISAAVWMSLILFSVILIIANIALMPVEYYLFREQQFLANVLLILFGQLVVWGLMLILLYFAISGMLTINKMKEKNSFLEMQESQFRSMQKYIKASEKTRHDFRHNILTLAELYNEGKTDEIGKYLNQYVDSLPKNEYVIFCGNTALNALLNYYVHVTSLNEIDFKLHISIPEHLPVSDVDLCSMVGNIMENAVIACQSADKKTIELTILSEKRMQLYIVVVNSFNGVARQRDGRYVSTKADGSGVGLASVAATAENYGGVAQFSHEGKLFYSNIAIPLNK